MNTLELYRKIYTYDTGNNLTNLSHQASSGNWQQTLTIHPNSNRGTETQQSTSDFDANGNLLVLDNIGILNWYYNNTLNKLSKPDKPTQYYVYDYQGKRVRSVVESNNQAQSQRDYLPALDISTNQPSKTTKQNSTHWYPHPQRKQQRQHSKSQPNPLSTQQSSTIQHLRAG
ncbi:hypothetical protein [bacterium endosymbiont of Bathymodiolus sp. 5 South]|uniref:hypothetical protein n=1 Tax=bacterium endosymbiont of Bathymodiolus sp. 5 South TaxID=1181670 RepID=UPI0010AFC9D2|nr:hypothetical protein [bacterium endosymbiont of Bathymodiolus sp. 5 South]SHN93278.1 hypothetical protein BCLUESOX_493 [bacterium endosymbiont of Bathymodiolus sp. 5 South]VVH57583.1 hypothetical protein BSPCLSOX_2130 [uncultured Gammaproteobacteria bacterium]